ncbi:MAG: type 1 glutamine amidotransferase domain-containing protein [Anaerolineae bacterium]
MEQRLQGKKVAILVEEGFEQVELTEPRTALDDAGADTYLISPVQGKVKGWNHTDWGDELSVDVNLSDARPEDYDALLLPGGVMNPDKMRMNADAVRFVKAFFDQHKPVAAICHGPWMLVEADVVRGRRLTSYPSLKSDLKCAGAQWVDEAVVTDGNLTTSRNPDDIPQFAHRIIQEFTARSARQMAGSRT